MLRLCIRQIEMQQYEDAGGCDHAEQRYQAHPDANTQVVAEQADEPDRADGGERHRQQHHEGLGLQVT